MITVILRIPFFTIGCLKTNFGHFGTLRIFRVSDYSWKLMWQLLLVPFLPCLSSLRTAAARALKSFICFNFPVLAFSIFSDCLLQQQQSTFQNCVIKWCLNPYFPFLEVEKKLIQSIFSLNWTHSGIETQTCSEKLDCSFQTLMFIRSQQHTRSLSVLRKGLFCVHLYYPLSAGMASTMQHIPHPSLPYQVQNALQHSLLWKGVWHKIHKSKACIPQDWCWCCCWCPHEEGHYDAARHIWCVLVQQTFVCVTFCPLWCVLKEFFTAKQHHPNTIDTMLFLQWHYCCIPLTILLWRVAKLTCKNDEGSPGLFSFQVLVLLVQTGVKTAQFLWAVQTVTSFCRIPQWHWLQYALVMSKKWTNTLPYE